MKIPPLQSLRSFEAVARLRSVTQAAEELCVSHSAVSHQVRKLEEWMGLALVERHGRGIRLSEAGERYKATLCEAFKLIHVETELLSRSEVSLPVRVSCLPMFAVCWLMPQMHDFWGRHSDTHVVIQYFHPSHMIDSANVDVAVRYGSPGDYPDFVAMPLLDGDIIPVASPDYLRRVDYHDLNDLPRLALLHDADRSAWQIWLNKVAMDYDFDIGLADSGTLYRDGNLALAACLAGEGVALLPREVTRSQLRAKTLVPLSAVSVWEDQCYLILTPKFRPVPRRVLIFAQWMQSLPGTIKLGMPRS